MMRTLTMLLAGAALCLSMGCGAQMQRQTVFEPKAQDAKEGAKVTDHVVKFREPDDEKLKAAGGEIVGSLRIEYATSQEKSNEEFLWPGASSDAATHGATHARIATVHTPHQSPVPRPAVMGPAQARRVVYELWRVDPTRWNDLPVELRPEPKLAAK
jgi:hypothetical protein